MLTALLLVAACGVSCRADDIVAPIVASTPASIVTADSACVVAQFNITSSTAVSTTFPNRATCTTKLVLIKGVNATWAQNPNRRLKLFVRILNKSGGALQMPVRLYLPATGIKVLSPSGTASNKVVPLTPDSAITGGSVWLIGGTGILNANDSTTQDTLEFNVQSPATQARLSFQATSLAQGELPPVPTGVPAWPGTPLTVAVPGDASVLYRRDVYGVQMDSTANAAQLNAVLSAFSGTIIGGMIQGTPFAHYLIKVPDPGNTYQQVDSVARAIRAMPGVKRAMPAAYQDRPTVEGRYPIDSGLAVSRTSWRTEANLWAWRKIRAVPAWGCENGEYGGTLPKVGVIDIMFPQLPGDIVSDGSIVLPPYYDAHTAPSVRTHGVQVAGLIGARGDDGHQATGLMWGLPLKLFVLGHNGYENAGVEATTYALYQAHLANVRVLNLSYKSGWDGDSTRIELLKDAIRVYLNGGERILVAAAGNDTTKATIAQIAADTSGQWRALHKALAQVVQAPGAPQADKILFVAAVDSNGSTPTWSQAVTGGSRSSIAAPGEGIPVVDTLGAMSVEEGTSYAAPLVTGTIAMLWASHPTLTATQIVDRLIAGAQADKVDSIGGPAAAVPTQHGLPVLDAYGALKYASYHGASSSPLCGIKVSYSYSGELTINRSSSYSWTVSYPNAGANFSVARGGRRLAAAKHGPGYGNFSTEEFTPSGSSLGVVSGAFSRVYLDKDTVDYFYAPASEGISLVQLSGKSGPTAMLDLDTIAEPNEYGHFVYSVAISPDAKWAIIGSKYSIWGSSYCTPPNFGPPSDEFKMPYQRTHLVRLSDSVVQLLDDVIDTSAPCLFAADRSYANWNPEGTIAITFHDRPMSGAMEINGWTAANPTVHSGPYSVADRYPPGFHVEHHFPSDGSYLVGSEGYPDGSLLVHRRPTPPFTQVSAVDEGRWWPDIPANVMQFIGGRKATPQRLHHGPAAISQFRGRVSGQGN